MQLLFGDLRDRVFIQRIVNHRRDITQNVSLFVTQFQLLREIVQFFSELLVDDDFVHTMTFFKQGYRDGFPLLLHHT